MESPHPGFSIQVAGYVDKMPILLQHILDRVRAFTVRPERFAVIKEKFVEFYKNWDYQQPYSWASRLAELVLQSGAMSFRYNRSVSIAARACGCKLCVHACVMRRRTAVHESGTVLCTTKHLFRLMSCH